MNKLQIQTIFQDNEDWLEDIKIYAFSKNKKDDIRYYNGYLTFRDKPLLPITIKHQLETKIIKGKNGAEDFEIKENNISIESAIDELDEFGQERTDYTKHGYGKYFEGDKDKIVSQAVTIQLFGDDIFVLPMQGFVNEVPNEGDQALNCCLKVDDYAVLSRDQNYEDPSFKYGPAKWRFEPQCGWDWDAFAEIAEALTGDGNFTEFPEFIKTKFPSSKINKEINVGSKTQAVLAGLKRDPLTKEPHKKADEFEQQNFSDEETMNIPF